MTGNSTGRVVVTERDERVLRLLQILRFLDAEQLRTAGGFTALRRTNRRLLDLYRAGFLKRWFIASKGGAPKAIYGLSLTGANVIGAGREALLDWKDGELIVTSQFLAHQQSVNTVFLATGESVVGNGEIRFWRTFKNPLSPAVPIKPDAYLEVPHGDSRIPAFLEVDRGTEPLKIWDHKASLYLKLAASGEFNRLFHQSRFRVLVVAVTEGRLHSLREAVARHTEKLFWFSTLEEIGSKGLQAAQWFRPKGEAEVSFR